MEIIVVVKLINEEILVGADVAIDVSGKKVTVKGPVRYQVRGNEVFLTPFFGAPKEITFDVDRVLYNYPIDEPDLIEKYKSMVNKSLIKTANNKIILAS